ncbi:MAG: AhpC/TSA antioxidant enzyme-domain-containing protein [Monoraphidium minutum]|nr:MAG: AhpC/TSA antioxidant enzyme-domain-containing protein [Monoraphidium minutum]
MQARAAPFRGANPHKAPPASRRGAAAAPAARGAAAAARRVRCAAAAEEYAALQGCTVQRVADGSPVELLSLWPAAPGQRVVLPFLTHFGDLTSWEFAQQLQKKALPQLEAAGVKVITVGLGSPENARVFASSLGYPTADLYADPTGACYSALAFSPGFAAAAEGVDPYLKLLPMLMGIGSPGTVQEVLRGYVGDREAPPVFDGALGRAFNILGQGYQRPMELATLRLQNMVGVLSKWGDLAPEEKRLLTQQGGCLVFDGCELRYKHSDPGILKYADVGAVVAAAVEAPRKMIAKQRE